MHRIDEHRLPGLGPMRLARLEEAGITTLEALVAADPEQLAELPGFQPAVVAAAREAAFALLAPSGPRELPEVPDLAEFDTPSISNTTLIVDAPVDPQPLPPQDPDWDPSSSPARKRMRRGLEAARRLEETFARIRQARALARRSEASEDLDLKVARKELKRLRKVLENAQRASLAVGLSRRAAEELVRLAETADELLDAALERTLDPKRARKLARRVHELRHEVARRLA